METCNLLQLNLTDNALGAAGAQHVLAALRANESVAEPNLSDNAAAGCGAALRALATLHRSS